MSTKIEWVDETWNPVTGCTRVSPGCDRCYAERFAERFRGVPGHHFERGFDVVLRPHRLAEPPRWKKPKRVFVNSMSDVFHRDVPDAYVDEIVATMRATPRHTYHVLTKRPERMRRYLASRPPTPENVWFGVSVESCDYAWRADMLRGIACVPRFLSLEPLLGPVGAVSFEGIDWVILGGESGPGARPLESDWVRDVRDRCARGAIPFFFKQWGGARKSYDVCELDGREHLAIPPATATSLA